MRSNKWSGNSRIQRANDIIDAIDSVSAFINGLDRAAFCRDRKTQSAVERELMTIAEACAKLLALDEDEPDDRKLEARFPDVPWRAIRGIGNILRHEYGRVDANSIWDTVDGGELEVLKRAIADAFPESSV